MTTRHCQRCGTELTDAASMNEGIGPICRKMDNEVLAQIIPANLVSARAAANGAMKCGIFQIEECRGTMESVIADLNDDMCRDWRKTVKRVEWMLSFAFAHDVKNSLIAIAHALGYTALAQIWTHQSGVPGMARVRVAEGRLFVKGPRSRGALPLLREMPGRRFEGESKEWSAPLGSFDAFARAVRTGYPKHEIDGFDSWEALGEHARKSATVGAAPATPRSPVQIKIFGALMLISSPKNYNFIDAVKALPYRDRRWSPQAMVWEVNAKHREIIEEAAKRCYGAAPMIEAA